MRLEPWSLSGTFILTRLLFIENKFTFSYCCPEVWGSQGYQIHLSCNPSQRSHQIYSIENPRLECWVCVVLRLVQILKSESLSSSFHLDCLIRMTKWSPLHFFWGMKGVRFFGLISTRFFFQPPLALKNQEKYLLGFFVLEPCCVITQWLISNFHNQFHALWHDVGAYFLI
jgi:hypothetical protein